MDYLVRAKFPTITLEAQGFRNMNQNITQWVGGSGPHVAMGWDTQLVETGRQGMYVALDSYIKRDGRAVPLQDYVDFQLQAQRAPGVGQFGLPMHCATYALLYNKAVLQRKGVLLPDDSWDWRRYQEALVKLTERDGDVWGGGTIVNKYGMMKVFQNGGEVVDPKDDGKAAFASPAGLEALQWVHDRLWRDRSWANTEGLQRGYTAGLKALAAGQIATYEDWASWALGDFVKEQPDAVRDWDMAPWPKGKQRVSRASIDAWSIWKGAPNADAAWELVKFLQTSEWLDIQARLAGYQHPRVSMQDHYVELLRREFPTLAGKNLQAFAHPIKNRYARPDAIFRKNAEAWKIIQETWQATMHRNEVPVSDAFRDAARRIEGL